MSRYRVPAGTTRIELKVSNSRFISTVGPAFTAAEAQAFIRTIREEMPDATHHVYAFKVGYGSSVTEGMSDDGEPSGTSGPPTLAVVRGADVGDIVLVTTRYFGGTKLGTGGLVQAYTAAAQAAIADMTTEEKVIRRQYSVHIPYNLLERVKTLLQAQEAILDNEEYGSDVVFRYRIPEENIDAVASMIGDMTAGQITPHPDE